ncbi:MAG: Glycosyl transferase family 1 domain-containing protein [uncultured Clostridium sp.]
MKNILIVINSLTIGGSEKSLVSLLELLDYSKYEVDLLMFKKGEDFDKYIPIEVNVLDEPDYYKFIYNKKDNMPIIDKIKYIACRLNTSIKIRINNRSKNKVNTEQVLYKTQKNIIENQEKRYDVAIAYSQGMPTYYVVDKVKAEKKVAWINCDYATTKYDKEFDYNYYKKIDKIIAVSQTIKKSIINLKPEYSNKIEVILDIVNPKLIENMSKEGSGLKSNIGCINILTVARLSIFHKGYDLAIKAARLLKDDGYNFKWYVIGDGPDRNNLLRLISEFGLSEYFILLGKKDNPYPYMKTCDLYVQPSKKEGFGLTVAEAKILKVPIVCTNFNTAKELISNNIDGLIVEINENDIYNGIKKYIINTNFIAKIKKNLYMQEPYNSVEEIKKIYNLLG